LERYEKSRKKNHSEDRGGTFARGMEEAKFIGYRKGEGNWAQEHQRNMKRVKEGEKKGQGGI